MSVDRRLRNELSRDASALDVDVDRFLGDVVRRGRRRQRIRVVGGVAVVTALIASIALVAPRVLDMIRHQRNQPANTHSTTPAGIEGTYTVEITKADTAGSHGRLEGMWQVSIRGDRLMSVTGPPSATGSTPRSQYQLDGDRFLTTAFTSATCPGVGVYTWDRRGSTLTFTIVSDACALRVLLFTSHAWHAR